jgi:hypothetical protein
MTMKTVVAKPGVMIAAAIAAAMIWVEHGHRVDIVTSSPPEVAGRAAACPENESVPHSADCFMFIQGGIAPDARSRLNASGLNASESVREVSLDAPGHEPPRPPCPPNNENVPYSASCLRFMSGWFWQANPTANGP